MGMRDQTLRCKFILKFLSFSSFCIYLCGCQLGYIAESAYSQAELLRKRVPITEALSDLHLTEEQKRKLRLAEEAHHFAETDLNLAVTQNYTTFVQLDGPYVTYVVSAAPKDELKPYLWKYPIIGAMPYKGYFKPEGTKETIAELKAQNLDVYMRGVSAYSTLGWFKDPILSSMLNYRDFDLVNTIIHETLHATIFFKSSSDFNESLANFVGEQGAVLFYQRKEGPNSPTAKAIVSDRHDEMLFSEFISKELDDLEAWYATQKEKSSNVIPESARIARIHEIQQRFAIQVRPKLKLKDSYKSFESREQNNASLLTYRLYYKDMGDFDLVMTKLGHDFHKFLDYCRALKDADDPKAKLRDFAHQP